MKKGRENIKYGADLIKVMATGGVVMQGDNLALPQGGDVCAFEETRGALRIAALTRTGTRFTSGTCVLRVFSIVRNVFRNPGATKNRCPPSQYISSREATTR
jgi:hypothetical protein